MKPDSRKMHVMLTLAGISGVVLPFVHFTVDQTAIEFFVSEPLYSDLWLLVAPCVLLPVAVIIGYATWLIRGKLPGLLVIANYALAVLSAFSALLGLGISGPYKPELVTMLLLFAIGFGSAAWLGIRGVVRVPQLQNLVTMQSVYIVPMAFWVAFAQTDFQIGAWLGAITLLAYLTQISAIVKNRWQLVAVILPVVSIVMYLTLTRQSW